MVILCKTKVLNVGHNRLHSTEWIIQMLSHERCVIEELNICHNSVTSVTACELLSYIKNNASLRLRSLNLYDNLIDDTISSEIAGCIMLEKVSLSGYYGSHKLTSITAIELFSNINTSEYSRLKTVHIVGDFTDDQVAYEIATCFQCNCILTDLYVSCINVSNEACLQMINALEDNFTLQNLWFCLECSECIVNKINLRIPIIDGKRQLSNNHLPKLSCNDNDHKKNSLIYISSSTDYITVDKHNV